MILVAVSGGVDSMVMLDLFMKSNIYFEILHINHNTRGMDNLKDLECIQNKIKDSNIVLHVHEYNHKSGNFQSEARKFRLEIAKKIIKQNNLKALAYGHHKDDQIENVLMNKDKISPKLMKSITDYEGIYIYRPLLGFYKNTIYQYAKDNNIIFNEDYSNFESKYKRNKFRNNIISSLSIDEKNAIYNREALYEKAFDLVKIDMNIYSEDIINAPKLYSQILIYKFIKEKYPDINVSKDFLNDVIKFINKNKNGQLSISDNLIIRVTYGKIVIECDENKILNNNQTLVYGENNFNGFKFYNDKYQGTIRVRKKNDKIKIKKGHKKVNRLFIDKKIDIKERDAWPIIVNQNDEIIWIPKLWRNKNEIS